MAIFRRSDTPEIPLVVSVTGVRLGQRVLVVAGRDRKIVHDLAARVGLTGRTFVLATEGDAEQLRAAAEAAGVLVDVAPLAVPLPVAGETFDIAVIDESPRADGLDTPAFLPDVLGALRPGGRVIVRLPAGGGLISRMFGSTAPPPAVPGTLAALIAAGFRAARMVAVHGGVAYVEASRAT